MAQLTLFDRSETLLVDAERGRIAYTLHYTHGVPKTTDAVGERISLAFRVNRSVVVHDSVIGRFTSAEIDYDR
jgi:hypothetical protein